MSMSKKRGVVFPLGVISIMILTFPIWEINHSDTNIINLPFFNLVTFTSLIILGLVLIAYCSED